MFDHTDYHTDQQNAENELATRFFTGRQVRYMPVHAEGDPAHADCENGVVSSVRGATVFVRFGVGATAQGCQADQLV